MLSNRNRDLPSPVIPLIRLWGADAGEDVRPGRFPPGQQGPLRGLAKRIAVPKIAHGLELEAEPRKW